MKKRINHNILFDAKIMHGKPCIQGTRIPIYLILQMLAAGQSKNEILKEYPQLSEKDINTAVHYGAKLATQEIEIDILK